MTRMQQLQVLLRRVRETSLASTRFKLNHPSTQQHPRTPAEIRESNHLRKQFDKAVEALRKFEGGN
jgi:hypothetical protein